MDCGFFILTFSWSPPFPICPLCPLSHSPQCQQYRESTTVLENQPAGTFVLQVHAVDADEGSNGRVTYGFMHKDSTVPAFSIHPDTGTTALELAQKYTFRRVCMCFCFQQGFFWHAWCLQVNRSKNALDHFDQVCCICHCPAKIKKHRLKPNGYNRCSSCSLNVLKLISIFGTTKTNKQTNKNKMVSSLSHLKAFLLFFFFF